MKKFKNKFAVTGSNSLLKAFEQELIQLGYKLKGNIYAPRLRYITLNGAHYISEQSCYTYAANNADEEEYNLPQDWNLALQAASELEEEVPEYVEITDGFGCWYKTGEIYKIYHADTKPGYLAYYNHPTDRAYWIDSKQAKVISKEVYDKQQQEIADKEVLEKLIKESGLKIGDKVTWGLKVNIVEIKDFNLIKNVTLEPTKFSPGNSQLAIYLGDRYKWYSASTGTLEVIGASKTLTLGSSNIEIKISKCKIEAQSITIPIAYIQEVVKVMTNKNDDGFSWKCVGANWEFKFPSVKIGCSTFTVAELEQIVETYNELNK